MLRPLVSSLSDSAFLCGLWHCVCVSQCVHFDLVAALGLSLNLLKAKHGSPRQCHHFQEVLGYGQSNFGTGAAIGMGGALE